MGTRHGAAGKAYIRNKRDVSNANWSNWSQLYTSTHPQTSVSGSSGSCTGNAATATALTSNAGSATQPVYFTGGKPTACTYTLGKSVPSDAKFTDTVYTLPNATSSVLGGVKVGSNITVSSGTISLTKANVTAALGYTPPTSDTNTTYSAGTGLSLSSTTFSVKYGTAAGTACQGNDSRLSNARPASDVSSWAKASSKPTYTYSEVGAAASSHTHSDLANRITALETELSGVSAAVASLEGVVG